MWEKPLLMKQLDGNARPACKSRRTYMTTLQNATLAIYLVLRPCPHDTFPNWARSIAPSSRPVARVHTGATGTLVPDPRDPLSTWNEWARSIAIGCALSNLSCGRSSRRYLSANQPLLAHAFLIYFFPF